MPNQKLARNSNHLSDWSDSMFDLNTRKNNLSLRVLNQNQKDVSFISGNRTMNHDQIPNGNIENFIGYAQVPIGLSGPLRRRMDHGFQDHYIPLATTEGALVASYNRGMKVIRESGGVLSACVAQGVQRSPFFEFESVTHCLRFIKWMKGEEILLKAMVTQTSNYAILMNIRFLQEGRTVIVTFEFDTGSAAGQNMVTISTDRLCEYIKLNCPVAIKSWVIESNYSGDKKGNLQAHSQVRGKKVISEIIIPEEIVRDVLKSTTQNMRKYFLNATLASIQKSSLGNHGHIANGLTAIFIACGQDVACIAESAVGILRFEEECNGDLYASLTLPSLIVGTVGGGTSLKTQAECLDIMDCKGPEKANLFAELCCATALAGELSIAAAIAEGHFTEAHKSLGRTK